MSMTIRESDVDVEAIQKYVTPEDVRDALVNVEAAMESLENLRKSVGKYEAPEILRALLLVKDALSDMVTE